VRPLSPFQSRKDILIWVNILSDNQFNCRSTLRRNSIWLHGVFSFIIHIECLLYIYIFFQQVCQAKLKNELF
jgi:hypothetical protein